MSYVTYDTRNRRPIYVGDVVIAEDEWGYHLRDRAGHTGRVVSRHGWLTTLERSDGTRFVADGHTTQLYHVI